MSFSSSYNKFIDKIDATNMFSSFSVEFFKTGSFVEVSNSTGNAHDVSFQSILVALKDIRSSLECQAYINECYQNPNLIGQDRTGEQSRFETLRPNLNTSTLPALIHWSYSEKPMRVIGKEFFSHSRAKVISSEQSKLFFNIISRFICVTNNDDPSTYLNLDTNIIFSKTRLDKTIDFIEDFIQFVEIVPAVISPNLNGRNIIYYGAPGTGKSHTIDLETENANKVVTVFHPDTQYNDFVGSLKPQMEVDPSDASKRQITYQFRPGPFTKALIEAYTKPTEHVYLVIEEINRAPSSAVFGELFQLLDRKDGTSKYKIDAADPDMLDYINRELPTTHATLDSLSIPSNLSLLATMNSSDQAVMPMDTAFKRRWSFKYIKIDFTQDGVPNNSFSLAIQNGNYDITWPDFAQIINDALITCRVAEDRLLGPFFLNKDEIATAEDSQNTLSGKLFVYLWDDVLRHLGHDKIFSPEYQTFGDLADAFQHSRPIFNDSIEASIEQKGSLITPIGSDSKGDTGSD